MKKFLVTVVFVSVTQGACTGIQGARGDDVPDTRHIVAGPRELLRLYQIGESQLDLFVDGEPLETDGLATLMRLLYRVPAFPLHKIHQWQQWEPNWQDLLNRPRQYRGAFVQLMGKTTHVERIQAPRRFVQRFGFDHYYRLEFSSAEPAPAAIVYSRTIPSTWANRLDNAKSAKLMLVERGSLSGMFLQVGALQDGNATVVLVTNAVAWHPDAVDLAAGITTDHVALANYGMDVAQFSAVEDRKPLTAHDRECFYQLLHTMPKLPHDFLAKQAVAQPDVTALLQDPQVHRGRLYSLVGTARRAIQIKVDDRDIVMRFGIRHYYEVEIFTDTAMTVRFVDAQGGEDKVFHRYPVVVCLRTLPAWMPVGEKIHKNVRVTGFFLKHWTYRSPYMSAAAPSMADGPDRLQLSPLLIGLELEPFEFEGTSDRVWGRVFSGIFVMLLIGIALYVWWMERGDREFRRRRGFN
ncbi:MAG: hypothetical protein O7B81_06745 [Gammaproteobacteria bacterium]|nr:hypothetical protein [Gammaproteobacteria bacterium]